jgi:hypothetical protein
LRPARPAAEFTTINKSQLGAMNLSADALYKMSDVELLAAYVEARRQFVERNNASARRVRPSGHRRVGSLPGYRVPKSPVS